MLDSNEDKKFLFPRSYVGRAIMFLFVMPLLLTALHWVRLFVFFSIGAVYKLYAYGTDVLELRRDVVYVNTNDYVLSLILGYIRHLYILLMQFIVVYFDGLLTTAVFAFVVWICLRYTRNGAFGKLEWFRVFAFAGLLWFLVPTVSNIVYYLTSDAYPSFGALLAQDVFNYIWFFVRFLLFYYLAKKLFISTTYDNDPLWKNEISAREFLSRNVKILNSRLRDFGFSKVSKFVLLFLAFDIILSVFESL